MKHLAASLLLLLAGCVVNEVAAGVGANRTSPWFETDPVNKSREDLTRTVRELIVRNGYRAPDSAPDEMIETDWDYQMSPRFRESFRTRLQVEILRADGGYSVRTRSWMEVNNNSRFPSDPDQAVWVGAGVADRHKDQIDEPAIKFHSMLKIRLFGLNQ